MQLLLDFGMAAVQMLFLFMAVLVGMPLKYNQCRTSCKKWEENDRDLGPQEEVASYQAVQGIFILQPQQAVIFDALHFNVNVCIEFCHQLQSCH